MLRLLPLLLLCGCSEWPATPEAAARRVGGEHVKGCILEYGCLYKQWCLDFVEHGYCADAGVPGCSRNEPEGLCS